MAERPKRPGVRRGGAGKSGPAFALNLGAVRCTKLAILGTLLIGEPRLGRVKTAVEKSEQGLAWPWLFSHVYEIDGAAWQLQAHLSRSDREGYDVSFYYEAGMLPSGWRFAPTSVLFSALGTLSAVDGWYGVAHFAYAAEEGTPVFTLPFDLPRPEAEVPLGAARIELRGMHLKIFGDREGLEPSIEIAYTPVPPTFSHRVGAFVKAQVREVPSKALAATSQVSRAFFLPRSEAQTGAA